MKVVIPVLIVITLGAWSAWQYQKVHSLKPPAITHLSVEEEVFIVTGVTPHGTGATVAVTDCEGTQRYSLNVTEEIGESSGSSNAISLQKGDLLIIQNHYLDQPDGPFRVYMNSPHDGVIQLPAEQ